MRKPYPAFTLLELLLASAILAVLLGITGSVTVMLLRIETVRTNQTNLGRILRNWTQILNDDFRSILHDTEQLNKASGNETIRHFGVSGTQTQLRIDVSWHESLYENSSAASSALRTIIYEFQPTQGFIRWERDYSAPRSAAGTAETAPEIIGGTFRYFDGKTWQPHWVSLDRKNLPAAIEVMLYLVPAGEARRRRHQQPEQIPPTLHRLVIQIPAAASSHQSYQREKPPKSEPPPLPDVPQIVVPQTPPAAPPQPFHSFFGD